MSIFIAGGVPEFQSTRLMRGVTAVIDKISDPKMHFNPHASCEA